MLTSSEKRKKIIKYSFIGLFFSLVAVMAVALSNINFKSPRLVRGSGDTYQLVLDSSNKVTSAGDKVQHTKLGNDVTFTYSNVANSTSGHVTLNSGGTVVNKDHIRSITSFTAVFDTANAISFKVSYDNATWGASTTMVSGYKYTLDSNPYFLHLDASASVTLNSLTITYSCVENPAAYEGQDTGESLLGVIDFWDSANSGDTGTSTLVNASYVQERTYDGDDTSNREVIEFVTSVSASYAYQKRYGGIGLSSGNNAASLAITLSSGFEPSSVVVVAGTQSPNKTLTLNSVGQSVTANCTGITALNDTYTTTLTWEFDSAPSTLTFTCVKSSKLAIYRIYLYGESGPTIEPPAESIIGFGASLAKGAMEGVKKFGILGIFNGGLTATAAGIAAAVGFGYLFALIFRAKTK